MPPNQINHLRFARYVTKRRSQEPYVRDPDDIIISKRAELFPTHRIPSRGSVADHYEAPKKKSMLSPIKQLIRKSKAKIAEV